MNEEKNELMETTEENTDIIDCDYYEVEEGGSGKAIALAAGLVTGIAALSVAVYKKLKAKKDDKPKQKKPKKRLRWVEVDEEENEVVESKEIDDEETENKMNE